MSQVAGISLVVLNSCFGCVCVRCVRCTMMPSVFLTGCHGPKFEKHRENRSLQGGAFAPGEVRQADPAECVCGGGGGRVLEHLF